MTTVTINNNILLQNNGNGTFTDISKEVGILLNNDDSFNEKSQGASLVDIDNDGDIDIIVGNAASPPRLYYNQATTLTNNNWIKFNLEAKKGESPLGALIIIEVGNSKYMNLQKSCAGAFGCDFAPVHFGIGESNVIDKVTITWPSGSITTMHYVDANQELTINEGDNYGVRSPFLTVGLLILFGGSFVYIRHNTGSR